MKILIDMNFSPQWSEVLEKYGWEVLHWSEVGDPKAKDRTIMKWANINGYIVLTHDLDFGTLLATTQAEGPSVIQVRTQGIFPDDLEMMLVEVLRQFESELNSGALIVVNKERAKVRILPLQRFLGQ